MSQKSVSESSASQQAAPKPAASSGFSRDPFDKRTAMSGAARPSHDSVERLPRPAKHEESVFHIEVEKIKPNPYQPRREFEPQALDELARSIREYGILQPLIVTKVIRETPTGTDVEYQLIAGERRLQAARRAGLERVPAIIRRVDEKRAKLELALIENIQRSDLNAMEAARGYARLQDEFSLTQREVAERLGKSREVVANALRLLSLPAEIQQALSEGRINESQARTLLSLPTEAAQRAALGDILHRGLSVRALKREVVKRREAPKDPRDAFMERELETKFGAPVSIVREGTRGRITVQFYSEEELRGIMERLTGE